MNYNSTSTGGSFENEYKCRETAGMSDPQAADTFFLPVILLPGTLPVKISTSHMLNLILPTAV